MLQLLLQLKLHEDREGCNKKSTPPTHIAPALPSAVTDLAESALSQASVVAASAASAPRAVLRMKRAAAVAAGEALAGSKDITSAAPPEPAPPSPERAAKQVKAAIAESVVAVDAAQEATLTLAEQVQKLDEQNAALRIKVRDLAALNDELEGKRRSRRSMQSS